MKTTRFFVLACAILPWSSSALAQPLLVESRFVPLNDKGVHTLDLPCKFIPSFIVLPSPEPIENAPPWVLKNNEIVCSTSMQDAHLFNVYPTVIDYDPASALIDFYFFMASADAAGGLGPLPSGVSVTSANVIGESGTTYAATLSSLSNLSALPTSTLLTNSIQWDLSAFVLTSGNFFLAHVQMPPSEFRRVLNLVPLEDKGVHSLDPFPCKFIPSFILLPSPEPIDDPPPWVLKNNEIVCSTSSQDVHLFNLYPTRIVLNPTLTEVDVCMVMAAQDVLGDLGPLPAGVSVTGASVFGASGTEYPATVTPIADLATLPTGTAITDQIDWDLSAFSQTTGNFFLAKVRIPLAELFRVIDIDPLNDKGVHTLDLPCKFIPSFIVLPSPEPIENAPPWVLKNNEIVCSTSNQDVHLFNVSPTRLIPHSTSDEIELCFVMVAQDALGDLGPLPAGVSVTDASVFGASGTEYVASVTPISDLLTLPTDTGLSDVEWDLSALTTTSGNFFLSCVRMPIAELARVINVNPLNDKGVHSLDPFPCKFIPSFIVLPSPEPIDDPPPWVLKNNEIVCSTSSQDVHLFNVYPTRLVFNLHSLTEVDLCMVMAAQDVLGSLGPLPAGVSVTGASVFGASGTEFPATVSPISDLALLPTETAIIDTIEWDLSAFSLTTGNFFLSKVRIPLSELFRVIDINPLDDKGVHDFDPFPCKFIPSYIVLPTPEPIEDPPPWVLENNEIVCSSSTQSLHLFNVYPTRLIPHSTSNEIELCFFMAAKDAMGWLGPLPPGVSVSDASVFGASGTEYVATVTPVSDLLTLPTDTGLSDVEWDLSALTTTSGNFFLSCVRMPIAELRRAIVIEPLNDKGVHDFDPFPCKFIPSYIVFPVPQIDPDVEIPPYVLENNEVVCSDSSQSLHLVNVYPQRVVVRPESAEVDLCFFMTVQDGAGGLGPLPADVSITEASIVGASGKLYGAVLAALSDLATLPTETGLSTVQWDLTGFTQTTGNFILATVRLPVGELRRFIEAIPVERKGTFDIDPFIPKVVPSFIVFPVPQIDPDFPIPPLVLMNHEIVESGLGGPVTLDLFNVYPKRITLDPTSSSFEMLFFMAADDGFGTLGPLPVGVQVTEAAIIGKSGQEIPATLTPLASLAELPTSTDTNSLIQWVLRDFQPPPPAATADRGQNGGFMLAEVVVPLDEIIITCFGDANFDGIVDFGDLNAVLGNWLNDYTPGTGPGDANFDGIVDFGDLNAVLGNWLTVCNP